MTKQDETITAAEAASLLGLKPRYFSEKFIFKHADFPKAIRYGEAGHRRYLREDVVRWRDKHRAEEVSS
jgi:hypothetical protein